MVGFFDDPQGLNEAAPGVEVRQTGQLTPGHVVGSMDDPPQRLVVSVHTAAIPGCEATCQEALYFSLMVLGLRLNYFRCLSLTRPCWALFLMFAPRYLKVCTFSTMTSLVFRTIGERLVVHAPLPPPAATSCLCQLITTRNQTHHCRAIHKLNIVICSHRCTSGEG